MTTQTKTKPKPIALSLTFSPDKETKGTWRFAENVDGAAEPKIGTLYVPKTTLATLDGWTEGKALVVSVIVE